MSDHPITLAPGGARRGWLVAAVATTTVVFACALYSNLALTVTNKANYRYFPPFKPYVNANNNKHLGAEYFEIAKSLVAGEGYANPFKERTGPTAWMPPILSFLLAGLLYLCGGSTDAVMAVAVVLQTYALVGTGILVLALARRSTGRFGALLAAVFFIMAVVGDFHMWFQTTHDHALILVAVDLLIAGLCWGRPLRSRWAAAGWGLFGGICAMINPIVALAWGLLSAPAALRERAWGRFGVAVLVAGLTLAPWIVRNYIVFGRLIPVKSNLAYELYQSQCLQPEGLLRAATFGGHPYGSAGRERREYKELGEMEFLDRKSALFWKALRADPLDFLDRVASRFLGVTLWYVPLDRADAVRRPWVLWVSRFTYPLPFLAILVLVFTAPGRPLSRAQWIVIGAYFICLLPYIAVSYYERYAMPLLAVKVLLVVWAADRLLSWRLLEVEDDDEPQVLPARERVGAAMRGLPREV